MPKLEPEGAKQFGRPAFAAFDGSLLTRATVDAMFSYVHGLP
jgi:hypothetical protein